MVAAWGAWRDRLAEGVGRDLRELLWRSISDTRPSEKRNIEEITRKLFKGSHSTDNACPRHARDVHGG